jgi:type II secretory pathway pseudopilin PulG
MRKRDNSEGRRRRRSEQGYVLLILLLGLVLLTVAFAAVAPSIAFQIKRDREEELIHRGVQYARAVRRYARQTHGFPDKLEQLQNRGGLRYIRKLYKDPVTRRDFRPIYTSDIAQAASAAGLTSRPGDDGTRSSNDVTRSPAAVDEPAPDTEKHSPGEIMFGVVSTSKLRTIREFNRKNRYNQWLFFFDPNYDRGLEINGPTLLTPTASLQTQPSANNGQQATAPAQAQPSANIGQQTTQTPLQNTSPLQQQ